MRPLPNLELAKCLLIFSSSTSPKMAFLNSLYGAILWPGLIWYSHIRRYFATEALNGRLGYKSNHVLADFVFGFREHGWGISTISDDLCTKSHIGVIALRNETWKGIPCLQLARPVSSPMVICSLRCFVPSWNKLWILSHIQMIVFCWLLSRVEEIAMSTLAS